MKSLSHYWYRSDLVSKIVSLLLIPLAAIFCLLATIRRLLYRCNILKSYSFDVPVVVIGNIVAGGSGKTPLIIALCELLQGRGIRVGVVSRGYGGNNQGVRQVSAGDTATLVGDEPLMIFQRTSVPVVVSPDRVLAVNFLLENNSCDIVLSDDGMQHYRMQRDLEISVVDASKQYGNGFCLPAGPLREPRSRLKSVDIIVENGGDMASSMAYELEIECCLSLDRKTTTPLSHFSGKSVHAVAAIGHPQRFFDQLEKHNITVEPHAYSDHYLYQADDFSGWNKETILMTEKDAVKCQSFDLPDAWSVRVKAVFSAALTDCLEVTLLPLCSSTTE